MHKNNIQTWYSSAKFLLEKLELAESVFQDCSILKIKGLIMEKLKSLFIKAWFHEKDNAFGKLDTYFSFKNCFQKEKYLDSTNFQLRKIICKFRISSHNLRVETERHKSKPLDRPLRTCKFCTQTDIENEIHFLTKCPFYQSTRTDLYTLVINRCPNFKDLDAIAKFSWLMSCEDLEVIEKLGNFLIQSFSQRLEKIKEG